jgi:hypothetical protein
VRQVIFCASKLTWNIAEIAKRTAHQYSSPEMLSSVPLRRSKSARWRARDLRRANRMPLVPLPSVQPMRTALPGLTFRALAGPVRLNARPFKTLPATSVGPNLDDRRALLHRNRFVCHHATNEIQAWCCWLVMGYCSRRYRDGRRWIVDAHREGRRYIVHSDELLSAFLELEQTLL